MNHLPARAPSARTLLALCGLGLGLGTVHAETSPYYLGLSESIVHDSNIYRLSDARGTPTDIKSRSDTSYATALVGGIDQQWGRQRLTGSLNLAYNKFQKNDQLNYHGNAIDLGWDWASVYNLSGNLNASTRRSLRRFDSAETGVIAGQRNIEGTRQVGGVVRLGVVTPLTVEAAASHRAVGFSADSFRGSEYRQDMGSLGGRYRVSGSVAMGLGWRDTSTKYTNDGSDSNRRDVDLTLQWLPSELTSLSARISRTSTTYAHQSGNDFSGNTGELQGSTQATGKLRLNARLSRDTGLSYSVFNVGDVSSATQFNRITDSWRLSADYAASAKISATASLAQDRRDLSKSLTSSFTLGGSDTTTHSSLGLRWTPLRSLLIGTSIDLERRTVSGGVGLPYSSTAYTVYGQFTLQ